MSRVREDVVEAVVQEISGRMADPAYAQVAIGSFAQAHPDVGRFITAHLDDLGGGEEVMHAVFHAEVLHQCVQRDRGRHLRPVTFGDLDDAADGDVLATFTRREPHLASYVASNVEGDAMKRLLSHVGLALAAA